MKPGLDVDSASLLSRMLDPNVKLGSSTPKADPSGDYAFEVFKKADAIKSGAQAELEKKALLLAGGATSAAARPHGLWLVCDGRPRRYLPDLLHQCFGGADGESGPADRGVAEEFKRRRRLWVYGDERAPPAPLDFAQFIVSPEGQKILVSHGFAAGNP